MPSIFFLKNLPQRRALQAIGKRYRGFDLSAVESWMKFLKVASDILAFSDAQLARRRTSQGRFCILMQLNLHPNSGRAPSELAEMIGVTRATITGLLDGLERSGLVRRERPAGDRRSFQIHLTPRARRLLTELIPERFKTISRFMGGLRPSERRELIRLLDKISRRLPQNGK